MYKIKFSEKLNIKWSKKIPNGNVKIHTVIFCCRKPCRVNVNQPKHLHVRNDATRLRAARPRAIPIIRRTRTASPNTQRSMTRARVAAPMERSVVRWLTNCSTTWGNRLTKNQILGHVKPPVARRRKARLNRKRNLLNVEVLFSVLFSFIKFFGHQSFTENLLNFV